MQYICDFSKFEFDRGAYNEYFWKYLDEFERVFRVEGSDKELSDIVMYVVDILSDEEDEVIEDENSVRCIKDVREWGMNNGRKC